MTRVNLGKVGQAKIEIFLSCVQEEEEDRELRDALENQLGVLKQDGLINVWHRGKATPGEEFDMEARVHLNSAHIILLLISASFLTTDYCYKVEMEHAMDRYDAGTAHVIPILLRYADWKGTRFAKLAVLPRNEKPIKNWSDRDLVFLEVVQSIRNILEEYRKWQYEPNGSEITIGIQELYQTLAALDYHEQAKVFKRFKDSNCRIGAFLIHGTPSSGQMWLLNRLLVKQIPGIVSAIPPFYFNFERTVCGRSLVHLWRALGKWIFPDNFLALTAPDSHLEVVKRVHRLWQTQTVILVLKNVHELEEIHVREFLQCFWHPLVEMAKDKPSRSPNNFLLMFLVDNDGRADKWKLPYTQQPDQNWNPKILIKLEKLTQFSHKLLEDWLNDQYETLPSSLTAQDILNNSYDGLPEAVLDHICELFGYDWPDMVKYRV